MAGSMIRATLVLRRALGGSPKHDSGGTETELWPGKMTSLPEEDVTNFRAWYVD